MKSYLYLSRKKQLIKKIRKRFSNRYKNNYQFYYHNNYHLYYQIYKLFQINIILIYIIFKSLIKIN